MNFLWNPVFLRQVAAVAVTGGLTVLVDYTQTTSWKQALVAGGIAALSNASALLGVQGVISGVSSARAAISVKS